MTSFISLCSKPLISGEKAETPPIFHIERLCECDVKISEGFLSSCMYATRYDLMPAECEVLIKLQNISDKSLKFPLGNQHFIDSFLCA